jgi:hypothetical protein
MARQRQHRPPRHLARPGGARDAVQTPGLVGPQLTHGPVHQPAHLQFQAGLARRQQVAGHPLDHPPGVAQHPAGCPRVLAQQHGQRALPQRTEGGIDQFFGQLLTIGGRRRQRGGQGDGSKGLAHRRHTNRGDGGV